MKKFIILAKQRSGSTYFYQMLDNHPQICCMDEIFREGATTRGNFTHYRNEKYSRKILYKLFGNRYAKKIMPNNPVLNILIINFIKEMEEVVANPELHKAFGFKIMYNQLLYNRPLEKWFKNEKIYLIHLIRKNALKIHLSWLARLKRGLAHSEKKVKHVKVYVDPENIINILDKIVQSQKNIKKEISFKFQNNPYLEVYYEDLLNSCIGQLDRVFEFLEIKKCLIPKPNLKKLNPDNISSLIDNYDEIRHVLEKSAHKNFLN